MDFPLYYDLKSGSSSNDRIFQTNQSDDSASNRS